MSLEAILAEIDVSGEAEAASLRAETAARVRQILVEAERAASVRREQAQRAALLPVPSERARQLHQAKLEALRALGEVRDRLVETALAGTRQRLVGLRTDPDYPLVLRRLAEEAIRVLGDEASGTGGAPCWLEADPRDEALLRRILHDLGIDLVIQPCLENWGGLVARSGDARIVVINTLEARLERATPFLRRELAAFFEEEHKQGEELMELASLR
jgi:V/A-type H+-transporting ATPase subunit E